MSADQPLAGVDASVNHGDWRRLDQTTWGTWARGFYVKPGNIVDFRARAKGGASAISASYAWPAMSQVEAAPRSADPCPGGCGAGTQCCQTSALANVTASDKRYACMSTTPTGACPAPDFKIDEALLGNFYFETHDFSSSNCAVGEGCCLPGSRRLLRFDVTTVNQGERDFYLGDPESLDAFAWDQCHKHYHFRDYTDYRLLDMAGHKVAAGHKQGFCLGDTVYREGSRNTPEYDCNNQGISAGWADEYGPSLDCQWIDITGVPPGSYILEVEVNPTRSVYEVNYSNNVARVMVTVP